MVRRRTGNGSDAGMDGPVTDAVLRLGRYFRTGEVSEDLRTLPAQPGTDGALAMSMGHVILREFFVDRRVPYGEYRRCEQTLYLAEGRFDLVDSDDPGAEFFSPSQLGRLAGSCYLFLGHPERAEPILSATADTLRERPKTHSLVLGNLALAYLRQRQLDAAVATLHDAIDLLDDSRGGGGMTVVFSAGRELYPWRAERAVHDIHDRLLALVARV